MSYSERRTRKDRQAKGGPTPRQRRLHPELYGVRSELDQFTRAVSYEFTPNGGRRVVLDSDLRVIR